MDPDLTGLEEVPTGARVVVSMSGGVDSAVAAARVKAAGFDAIGITLQLYDHGKAIARKGACCAGEDIHDARRIADALGIPHYVLDYEARFRAAVMDDFAARYAEGKTPVPCVRCNQRIKFQDLLGLARDLGGAALVTGHYARRVPAAGGARLLSAVDPARDQSYFLFATRPEELAFLRFPLGHMTKREVRAIAVAERLPVADKADSQDLCFVPDGRYAAMVERLRPGASEPGEIVDLDGRVLGRHPGIIHFTVGQRRRLGLDGDVPLFVVALDAPGRRVIVGPREALLCGSFTIGEVNWLAEEAVLAAARKAPRPVLIKVRSSRAPRPALLSITGPADARLEVPDGEEGVAPGQACVIYERTDDAAEDGLRVLGGGFILRPQRLADRARCKASGGIVLDAAAGLAY